MQSGIQIYSVQPDGELVLNSPNQSSTVYSSRDIINFLTRRLPYSLPILRRLQLGPRTGITRFITTPLPSNAPAESKDDDPGAIRVESLWAMAFDDREGYPSTEIWTFTSLELYHGAASFEEGPLPPDAEAGSLSLPFTEEVCKAATAQLLHVLSNVLITSHEPAGPLLDRFKNPGNPGSNCCLAGNVHSTTAALLTRSGVVLRPSPPYGKYLFSVPPPDASQAAVRATAPDGSTLNLPEGLVWSTIQLSDYTDVMAANKIVRSTSTIADLSSVAVRLAARRPNGDPGKAVAFAFAAGDGSVRTLHVDPQYRRRGLAKAVVSRLLGVGAFEPPTTGPLAADAEVRKLMEPTTLAFTSIERSNVGSVRTFEAIGGKWYWDVYWLWLDLAAIKDRAGQHERGGWM